MGDTESTATRRSVLKGAAATGATVLGLSTVGSAVARNPPPGDEPVLLVNGYSDTEDTPWWDVLVEYLTDVGYDAGDIYRLDIGDIPGTTVDSPAEYADLVAAALERISGEYGSEVDIIAHSMGGLDSRWAIEKQGAARYVDDLVTLGTPHQGTYAAYLGLLTEGGRDMIPGSTFLTQLNDDQLAQGVSYTALWSYGDQLINPDEYAKLPPSMVDSTEVTRNINTGYEQHIELIYDRDVFEQYVQFLD